MDLNSFFEIHRKAAVAFSGGTDSSYLLYAAKKYGADVTAYCAKTAFQPAFELEDARKMAGFLNVGLRIVEADVLSCREVTENGADRCYHCKKHVFSAILESARRDGYDVLLDGTNASDKGADRPGMRAAAELEVISPLRLCGLTKTDVRRLSKEAGLFTWDKPAYACLATRIETGRMIDGRLLRRTERAEEALREMDFSDFRVRTVGESAKLQMTEKQIPAVITYRERILEKLGAEYESVLLDLEVRREQ